ncbi:hypothetical protein F4777DRAFT_158953 [Nemania sp. FL0916]|nr:hypothetical protein F4777DRAFT_158953 [Nemania sp. FL0916]
MAPQESHYDFIIVGGGTAGNVVAGRLAENPNVSVLVIEAGVAHTDSIEEITTPSSAMSLRGTQYDWGYKTTMVKRDDYERIEKPNTRGKGLGGSSTLNYFTWIPGCKVTFDNWAAKFGGEDWAWDRILPYFRKPATYHDEKGLHSKDLKKLGTNGPLPISHAELLDELAPFRERLTKAWTSRGHKVTENIYDGTMIGLNHCVDSIYHGKRSGSFLFVRNKPNVTIMDETHSKKLIINEADKTAKGVTVIDKTGKEVSFYATREVIVSQGVFETPKLLMLSGIGPKDHLTQHGIRTIVDSPHVGQNLSDHPAVPFVLRVKDGFGMDNHLLRPGPENAAAIVEYKQSSTGPAASGLLELVGFPRIDDYFEQDKLYRERKAANGGVDPFCPEGEPHFELDFVSMFGTAFQWHYPVPKEGCYVSVVVDLVQPVSPPGEVTLQSADPLVQPAINLNFFADELDIVGMRQGVRFTYDVLTKGEGFKDIVVGEYPWDMPLDDDAAMRHAVLDRCQTAFHPCGTARLSKDVGQGVVDSALRVHGVKNLRVADASVMPLIPTCRIQNAVYMVGEKAADLLKAAHKDLYAA